jgi:hypothetical protein
LPRLQVSLAGTARPRAWWSGNLEDLAMMNILRPLGAGLITAWAFIHAAAMSPASAQEDTVSRGIVVSNPNGPGNAIVSVPQTMSADTQSSGAANVTVYADPGGSYGSRYSQGGSGGMRYAPVPNGALQKVQ